MSLASKQSPLGTSSSCATPSTIMTPMGVSGLSQHYNMSYEPQSVLLPESTSSLTLHQHLLHEV